MKNLKRFLSLALSGVMLVGMMAFGASAAEAKDFTDVDEIQNKQAVTTMASLNVINGKDTGAFDPEGIVTRAEMAKMITIMMNGGKEPVLPVKATPTYTDIGGHWAEKYIEYCSQAGIIAGRGDGTFAPDETVTASQAAKMALVALGYDSNVFKFTGIDWEVNVNSRASAPDADLYDDFAASYDPSQGMKRDDAALLLYNTLDAKVMSKSYDTIVSNGEVTQKYSLSNEHFIEDRFNAVKVEGVVIANEDANLNSDAKNGGHLDENRTRVAITNFNGDGNSASNDEQSTFSDLITVQATTGLDELGRKVTVYVKKNSTKNKAEILGDVIVSADNVVITKYNADSIKTIADDNGLNIEGAVSIAYDYQGMRAATVDELAKDSTRGVEKILIDCDDDGDLDYVLVNLYRFGKVTSYSATGDGSIQISADKIFTADKSKDVVGFEDVAKNDYVLVNYIGGKVWVEKAETVTGEIKAYKTGNAFAWDKDGQAASKAKYTTKLTVDDKEYNVSTVAGYVNGADSIQSVAADAYGVTSLNNSATFYIGKGDMLVAAGDVAETAYNYAIVLAKDTGINEQVKVALSDGTKATYTLNTNGLKFDAVKVGGVYGYNLTSTGTIKLQNAASSVQLTKAAFSSGKTTIAGTGVAGKQYANTNTAFFYVSKVQADLDVATPANLSKDDVNVYTGYNKAVTLDANKNAVATIYKNNAGNVVAVRFAGLNITKADVNNFMYLHDVGMTNADYTNGTAFVDGSAEDQDIQIDGTGIATGAYLYTVNSNGYYELETPSAKNVMKDKTVTKVGRKSFVVGGQELEVNADTLLVDDSEYLDDPVAELGKIPEEDDIISFVLFDLDSAGKPDVAKLIVVVNKEKKEITVADDSVVVVSNGDNPVTGDEYYEPLFYTEDGHTITVKAMKDALIAKMIEDGCTDISMTSNTAVKFTKGGATSTTTFANSGLSQAKNQVYKVTVSGKTDADTGVTGTKITGYALDTASLTITAGAGRQAKVSEYDTTKGEWKDAAVAAAHTVNKADVTITFEAMPKADDVAVEAAAPDFTADTDPSHDGTVDTKAKEATVEVPTAEKTFTAADGKIVDKDGNELFDLTHMLDGKESTEISFVTIKFGKNADASIKVDGTSKTLDADKTLIMAVGDKTTDFTVEYSETVSGTTTYYKVTYKVNQ